MCGFILRKSLLDKPENIYLIIILSITLLFSWSTGTNQYSWDDGIHYKNVLIWADPDESVELSTSDFIISSTSKELTEGKEISSIYDREFELNYFDSDTKQILDVEKSGFNVLTKIAYFPSAIVLYICQVLNISFSVSFVLGKLVIAIFTL